MTWNWGKAREEYGWLAVCAGTAAVTFLIASIAGFLGGVPAHRVAFLYMKIIFTLGPAAILLAAIPLFVAAIVMRIPDPLTRVKAYVKERFGTPALALAGLAPIVVVPVMMGAFGTLKMLMPLARSFTWDDWLANADKALFLGYQPWQYTHALFGGAAATKLIDIGYTAWVAMLFTAVLYFAWLAPRYERARFFLSFTVAWLMIGVIGAYAFASAGPCYTAAIGAVSASDFQPLMDRLRAIHEGGTFLAAYDWQGALWEHHVNRDYAFAMGVSAMPSMHNAITILYALTLRRARPVYRLTAWAFVAMIFLGSIHLGWHYALDGILAWAMMWAIWVAAGAFLDGSGYGAAVRGENVVDAPRLADRPVAV
jgi:hypothetical protein